MPFLSGGYYLNLASTIYYGLKRLALKARFFAQRCFAQSHPFRAGSRFHDFDPHHIGDMAAGQNHSNFVLKTRLSAPRYDTWCKIQVV
jgi:hypothetical protein